MLFPNFFLIFLWIFYPQWYELEIEAGASLTIFIPFP